MVLAVFCWPICRSDPTAIAATARLIEAAAAQHMTYQPQPDQPPCHLGLGLILVSRPEAPGRGAGLPLPSATMACGGSPAPCPDRAILPPTLKHPHTPSVPHDEVPVITPQGVTLSLRAQQVHA